MPQLGSLALGAIVKVRENGVVQDFYLAAHGYPSSSRTLLVRRYVLDTQRAFDSVSGAYFSSAIDDYVNNTWLGLLDDAAAREVGNVTIVASHNHPGGTTQAARKAFVLSIKELGRAYQDSGTTEADYANIEGQKLPTASMLTKATTSSGLAVAQWTRSTYHRSTYTSRAYWIGATGIATWNTVVTLGYVRPCFTLPFTIEVNANNEITLKTPSIPHHIKPLG